MTDSELIKQPFFIPDNWGIDLEFRGDDEFTVYYQDKPNCMIEATIYDQ